MDYEGAFGQSVAEPRRHTVTLGCVPRRRLRSTAGDLLRCFASKKLYPIRREALRAASTEETSHILINSKEKRMKKLLMSIAAGMLLVPGLAMAKDTTFTGEIMDSACAEGGGHESMFKKMGTNDPKACTEACLKGGSKYVLFKADKTFYQLDDQKKPASFAGQKVEVTGTLDKASKTIHVTGIKAAS
jgi:hypothetical protein